MDFNNSIELLLHEAKSIPVLAHENGNFYYHNGALEMEYLNAIDVLKTAAKITSNEEICDSFQEWWRSNKHIAE